ncbi:hypothetical protein EV691_11843 [Azotobacter chroococcum]|uniref:IS5/IS1182 family transposase n=1 Tax=Azotobacter chroococcum TaxID=353 RepID=A0A4R1PIR1_9GAMM|nr:hypothetical protein EV691_11843 [Azotobacter chroococcum]
MKQLSFADAEYAGKRKQTRRERFLAEMEQVVPWAGLLALIESFYPKAGKKPHGLHGTCASRGLPPPRSANAHSGTWRTRSRRCVITWVYT